MAAVADAEAELLAEAGQSDLQLAEPLTQSDSSEEEWSASAAEIESLEWELVSRGQMIATLKDAFTIQEGCKKGA